MAKKSKLQTPQWMLDGYDSEAEYMKDRGISKKKVKGRTFKVRSCPKCGSSDVFVVLIGEEGKRADNWECKKCKWNGKNVKEEELSEEEFLERMEKE
ncbi:MAG: hypothetical protein AABW50_01690 [Nanoarchaeota archaeon]